MSNFIEVFRVIKDTIALSGVSYTKTLTPEQQVDLRDMAEEAYDGIREGDF